MIRQFNNKGESALVFLISTRAGSLGVNLIGSNRLDFLFYFRPPSDRQSLIVAHFIVCDAGIDGLICLKIVNFAYVEPTLGCLFKFFRIVNIFFHYVYSTC